LAQWEGAQNQRTLKKIKETFGEPKGAVRLDPDNRIWADKKKKRVIVDGVIALREGPLEMLACIVGTKEHESVVAVYSKAFLIHAGLLAIGAEKGKPVQWRPEYQPPTGSEIRVIALWKDEDGKKHAMDARKWVRESRRDGKALDVNWVFAGSIMYKDPESGKETYEAEQGDLICVANFSTATLDIPIRSLKANSLLEYGTFTENIPPSGTPVRLVLEVIDSAEPAKEKDETADAASEKSEAATAKLSDFSLASYEKLLDPPPSTASEKAPLKTAEATKPQDADRE
jgi:hypothetical protein